MGSPFRIVLYAKDSATAHALVSASWKLVDSLNTIFSDYIPDSELNRLSATAGKDSFVAVSAHLYTLFLQAEQAWQMSDGRFDITIGALTHAWRRWRNAKSFPPADSIGAARQKTGFSKVVIDRRQQRIKLAQQGMQLDLGGIAAGYVAESVVRFLTSNGISIALADASGDIVCSGSPPGRPGWIIGVNRPGKESTLLPRTISLSGRSVSTSGDVFQYMEHEGKRYSHIIDPRTGYGVTAQRNVTVIAVDGATADWLASACSILPLKKARALARRTGSEFLITEIKRGKLRSFVTRGFKNYWNKQKDIL
ncbi:MAG TPA: FAD:protein FMN transferase [Flavisolibacter sp.]|nr:FAD:protein FMN transferase [Flavisolibacter sp.]